jgi:hypothetical protein
VKEWLSKLALVTLAALAPIHPVLISVGILVAVDLLTGVWAALKFNEKISSAKLRNTFSKLLIYQIGVITAFVLEVHLLDGLVPAVKIVAGLIGAVEGLSAFENLNKISGNNLFKALIERLGSSNLPPQNDKSSEQ